MKRGFDRFDGGQSGTRKRFRGSDFSGKFESRILLASRVAGSLIGRGGANIKKLRAINDSSIRIPDSPGPERLMTILGDDRDAIIAVLEECLPLMSEEVVYGGRGAEVPEEANVEIRLLIHASIVGGVIGRGGEKIRDIRKECGVGVKVMQECAPQSTDRCVSVSGLNTKVIQAIGEIYQVVADTEIRGEDEPYDPINFDPAYASNYGGFGEEDEFDSYGSGGRNARGNNRGNFRTRGGFGAGRGDHRGGDEDRYSRADRYEPRGHSRGRGGHRRGGYVDDDYDQSFGRGSTGGGLDENFDEPTESTQVTVPSDMTGAIIGQGGSRIRTIRNQSGATIIIDDPLPGSNENIITIEGTQSQIHSAQYILQQTVRQSMSGRSNNNGPQPLMPPGY